MDDTRSQYRARQGRRHVLEVSLLFHDRPPVRGEILDLSHAGAGIRFELDVAPQLRGGEDVQLAFLVRGTGRQITCGAVVQHRREDAEGCRYGFQFLDSGGLRDHLDPGLMRFFNRRRKVRVRPCSTDSVAVELDHGGTTVRGALLNISETGLSVRLAVGAMQEPPRAELLGLSLTLPGQDRRLCLTASLRYLSTEATAERWGLEFEAPDDLQLEVVRAYVAERLNAITQNRSRAA